MRLSEATLYGANPLVARVEYDRTAQAVGIVHLGIGAFHRAHQAWYTDRVMAMGAANWAICGVSMRSDTVARQLNPQDGLYSITERSEHGATVRIIGSVTKVLVASTDREAVIAEIASADTRIVSFTVTEKGYCRLPDGSLDAQTAARGFYPLLAEAFRRRRDAGTAGLTLLSCDNLASNGATLGRLIYAYLAEAAPDLCDWFVDTCTCPSTMVDRIVPATLSQDLEGIAAVLGVEDAGAVVTEPFSQWIIEDKFAGVRPPWEEAGAQLVADVGPYETAKLRMLNGAHSALAYLGLERGHEFVHQAIADPALRSIVERIMRDEAAKSFAPAPGQLLDAYADALLGRFANPSLAHHLRQIAMDGSQKVSQRWLETIVSRRSKGLDSPAILTALAAWVRHVRGDRIPVDDPQAERLAAAWSSAGEDGICDALFGDDGLLRPSLAAADREQLRALV
ncbi:mannitol dehydrogenase family protein [Sphingomonas oryzagri]